MKILNCRPRVWALCGTLCALLSASTSPTANSIENGPFHYAYVTNRSGINLYTELNYGQNQKISNDRIIEKVALIFANRIKNFPKEQIPQLAKHFVALC